MKKTMNLLLKLFVWLWTQFLVLCPLDVFWILCQRNLSNNTYWIFPYVHSSRTMPYGQKQPSKQPCSHSWGCSSAIVSHVCSQAGPQDRYSLLYSHIIAEKCYESIYWWYYESCICFKNLWIDGRSNIVKYILSFFEIAQKRRRNY